MFCPKCGEKNKEGAAFCVKCGEKLSEKATKSKATKTTKITTDDVKELTKEVTKEMTSDASSIIKDMISKPVDSLKKYGDEKRFNLALVLVGIMSLLVGLFIVAFIKNVYSKAMGAVGGLLGSSMYGYGSYGLGSNMNVEIPYFKMFIYGALATFALSFVFVGVLYLVNNMIFKGKENFKS